MSNLPPESGFFAPTAPAIEGINVLTEFQRRAVELFAETGNMAEVARQLQTSVYEIQKLAQQVWWHRELAVLRACKNAVMDCSLTRIMDKTLEEMEDRLLNGEEFYDANGNLHMRPVDANTLNRIMHTLFDKRQLLRLLPTGISEGANGSKLAELKSELERLTELSRAVQAKTIDMEPTEGRSEPSSREGRSEPRSSGEER